MRWRDPLPGLLTPRLEPESLDQRVTQARRAGALLFLLLGLWFAADLAGAIWGDMRGANVGFDLVALALGGLTVALAFVWLRRRRVVAAGYLLAAVPLLLTAFSILAFPDTLFMAGAGFPIAILLAGAIVSGAAAYLFAAVSAALLVAAWLIGLGPTVALCLPYDCVLGLVFVLSQIIVYAAAAVTLDALSRQAQQIQTMFRDQTERMTQLAHTDALTGLANRRQLIDQLGREFARARRYRRPLGLLYLDLDGFKGINDRFGHMFGDDLLRTAANSMRAVLRSTDLLARIGGDEFAVLLPETPLPGVENVATKLHRSLASYSQRLGPAIGALTVCIGASQLHDADASIDDLLTRADNALLDAKGTGPGSTRTARDP